MNFPSTRIEGTILSGELLDKLESADSLGQRAVDFGLDSQAKLKDEIVRAWTAAQAFYTAFQYKLASVKEGAPATTETRNQWVIPLLGLLGYAELEFQSQSELVGDKPFRISHRLRSHGGFAVHIVGARESLDKKPVAGSGARVSPHAHLQEYLNLTEHLYGIVTNGKLLRLLRDSTRLIKLSYVEFDLDRMFGEELFADFAVLYRLLHVTRLPELPEKSAESLLERYHQDALESGARIRDGLSFAVEQVLQELGCGFLAQNERLQSAVANNSLTARELHHGLLRLIYRLLLMMVAEERGLLFAEAVTLRQRKLYFDHYSIARLRRLAERRALVEPAKYDLWRGLRSTFRLFETDGLGAPLGLAGLGGQLFSASALGPLQSAELDNGTLLSALAKLSLFRQPDTGQLSRVNYGALATEEFGSVYERLLELHPVINSAAGNLPPTFGFKQVAGNERKTTGSYYTPSSLVECLLDSALDPVLEDRLKSFAKLGYKSADEAVLSLKVCDPACGSGHFLIAAAQRIARRLALLRSKGDEPSVSELRHTLREVISHCIYGVDSNPMSVELCKVALWLEAMEAGKPLSFLDHHIRCGNSLLGATPELIAKGIPDDAFTPIEGDDKKACAALKKLNARERKGFGELFALEDRATSERLQQAAVAVENLSDDSVRAVEQKSAAFEQLQNNYDLQKATDLANLWCAAFVIRKRMADEMPSANGESSDASQSKTETTSPTPEQTVLFGETFAAPAAKEKRTAKITAASLAEAIGITSGHLRDLAKGAVLPEALTKEVKELAGQFNFFHWHLAFAEVFKRDGFDVILGNPPWENLQTDAQEFFASTAPQIAAATNMAQRNKMIFALKSTFPLLFESWTKELRNGETTRAFFRLSGRYPLTTYGRLNTYGLFAELANQSTNACGRWGMVLPIGLATDAFNQYYFADLIKNERLVSFFGFENEDFIFPQVHHAFKFALVTVGGKRSCPSPEFAFFLRSTGELSSIERKYTLSRSDFELINPNTLTCPVFRTRRETDIAASIYRRFPVILREKPLENPWGVKCQLMFMMNSVSEIVSTFEDITAGGRTVTVEEGWQADGFLPLYEAKMFHQFDHRFGTYFGQTEAQANQGKLPELSHEDHSNPSLRPMPRYWVSAGAVAEELGEFASRSWFVSWRDVTSSVVLRTAIVSIIPFAATNDSAALIHFPLEMNPHQICCFVANANTFAFDFVTRQKLGGNHLRFFTFYQLPAISPQAFLKRLAWLGSTSLQWILPRVLELTYTAWDLEAFAQDCGWPGPPLRWDEERRFQLRCELDAAFFHLYGLNRDDTTYILDTFPIVKRKDEEKFGTYRTKDRILELYDSLADCQRTGKAFVSSLNPPPADERCCHPPKQAQIPAPTWMDRPLALPTTHRVVLTPERYRATLVPHLLYQAGGSLPFDRFRKAYWLLTEPGTLKRYATGAEGKVAAEWARTFKDTLAKDQFIEHLKGAVGRQLHFVRKNGELWLELRDAKVANDEHVIFDSRLALLVADLWPLAEPIAPLVAAEEIAIQQLEAVL